MDEPKNLSLVISVSICLVFITLINPNLYSLLFGWDKITFPSGLECFITMGIYPLVGLIFAFLERKSRMKELHFFLYGGIASGLLFILFVISTIFLYPEGIGESVQDMYLGFDIAFPKNKFLGLLSVILGFSYAVFWMAILGGTSSFLLSLFFKKNIDEDQRQSISS
jgi:hypothetical protein